MEMMKKREMMREKKMRDRDREREGFNSLFL
jgi:hypothetical protein